MKGQVFKKISARLKLQVPELKRIDFSHESLEVSGMITPCVILSFGEGSYTNQGRGLQHGDTTIIVQVVQTSRQHSFKSASGHTDTITMLDFSNKVYIALQGFSDLLFSALNRVSDSVQSSEGLLIESIEFSTTLFDSSKRENSALNITHITDADLRINKIEIKP